MEYLKDTQEPWLFQSTPDVYQVDGIFERFEVLVDHSNQRIINLSTPVTERRYLK